MAPRYKYVILLSFLALAGCGGLPPVHIQLGGLQTSETGEPPPPPPRPEIQVFAGDREAAAVARELLRPQAAAADAAVALAMTLAVTRPSAAGLGGGGVCVARAPRGARAGLAFPPPAFARGLQALHARYGARPWSSLVSGAEALARFGHPVSTALADDLARHGASLARDSAALAAFMTPERRLIAAGDIWRQPGLADSLAHVRGRASAAAAGAAPAWFAPPPDGAAAAPDLPDGAVGFAVGDAAGAAVACVLTMGRPFGTGAMDRDGGYLVAAPAAAAAALARTAVRLLACVGAESGADTCPLPAATSPKP